MPKANKTNKEKGMLPNIIFDEADDFDDVVVACASIIRPVIAAEDLHGAQPGDRWRNLHGPINDRRMLRREMAGSDNYGRCRSMKIVGGIARRRFLMSAGMKWRHSGAEANGIIAQRSDDGWPWRAAKSPNGVRGMRAIMKHRRPESRRAGGM